MASFTQLRLQQLTGSAVDLKAEVGAYITPVAAAALTGSDFEDLLGALGAAVQRIHGRAGNELFEQVEGRFDTTTVDFNTSTFDVEATGVLSLDSVGASNVTTKGALTISGSSGLNLASHGGEIDITAAQGLIDINATLGAVDIDAQTSLSLDGAGGINIGVAADVAIDIDASTLDIDASGAVTLDGAGVAIAGGANASSFNVATGGADAKDLTISVTGGGNSSLLLSAAGTGTDALSIDASAGDMVIGPSLLDTKTLKLGKNGAVEVIIAPSDTAADEKYSVVNTSGDAADAIKLQSVAGSILFDADAAGSAIKLDSEGTGAASIAIDSAGGVDITSAGAHPIDIESTNAAGHIVLKTAHTSGLAFHIDANADAGSEVQIDAGVLDIDVTGAATIDSVGMAINAGNAELDLTTTGDVDINGAGIAVDASAALSLNAGAASDLTVTAGGLTLSSAGDAASFTVASDSAGEDLTIEQTGGNDSGVLIQAAGTGADAIKLNATAGGIQIGPSLADGKILSLGKTGTVEVLLIPNNTPADEKFSVVNTAGTSPDAVKVQSVAGSILLDVDAATSKIHLDSEGSGPSAIHLDSAGGIDIDAAGGPVDIAATAAGVVLSGSMGIGLSGSVAFSADGAMASAGGAMAGSMAFAAYPEFSEFRTKDLFSSSTTVVGALNALADAASGGSVVRAQVVSSVSANADVTFNNSFLSTTAGYLNVFDSTSVEPANTELYVNGQLLLSGTSASGDDVTGGDYVIKTYADPAVLKFAFDLEEDDIVFVKSTAVQ